MAKLKENSTVGNKNITEHFEKKATENELGHVKVDGDTITIDPDGVISAVVSKLNFYDNGFENEPLTGGWKEGDSNGDGTQSKENDHLYVEVTGNALFASFYTYVTSRKVNLQFIDHINVKFIGNNLEGSGSTGRNFNFNCTENPEGGGDGNVIAEIRSEESGENEIQLDVSNLSGEYYLSFYVQHGNDVPMEETSSAEVYEIRGVRE